MFLYKDNNWSLQKCQIYHQAQKPTQNLLTIFNPIIKADELLFKWYEYMKYISSLIFPQTYIYLDHQGKFRRCDGSGQVESCGNK